MWCWYFRRTHVVDIRFAGAGDQEKACGQPPHGVVLEEDTGFIVEQPVLFPALLFFAFLL
jgi:hypothetical protein